VGAGGHRFGVKPAMTRRPEGYIRVQRVISIDQMYRGEIPREHMEKIVARETAYLLECALLTRNMDTTAPIFIDGATRTDYTFTHNVDQIKVTLDYRQRGEQRKALDHGSEATNARDGIAGRGEDDAGGVHGVGPGDETRRALPHLADDADPGQAEA
jgi:hypothetical protein